VKKYIPPEPVLVSEFFPEMRAELLGILESLTDDDWNRPTACEGWSVRDVAQHILADDIGLLSGLRDHDGQYGQFDRWEDLVVFINARNDLWVRATRRLSRRVLMTLLAFTAQQWHEFIITLDPHKMAGPIGWTGNDSDPMWLHLARELTEYWMHHQHICEAVGKTSLKGERFVNPVLSTFAQALPHTYRNTQAPVDTLVKFIITGEGGRSWFIVREATTWKLYSATGLTPTSIVSIDTDTAWRMFTRGLDREVVRQRATIEGDPALGEIALSAVAIIA
jgi:uncharacterized protein (TIGR03083 family)